MIADLTLIKELGKGTFGKVWLTSKQGTIQKFATKQIDKKYTLKPQYKKYLDNEINILKEIEHENLIKLYEVHETSQYFYLVMEYCNGGCLSECLEDYKKRYKKPFPEEIVQFLMKQIVSGINYLHKKNILHRDIKLDNILLNFDSEEDRNKKNILKAKIKIIDFGFARHLEANQLAYSTLGSPINMDPGILRKLNKIDNSRDYGYDQKADIWSLGTICYEMLVGKCTFDAESMRELLNKVERGNYFLPTYLSKEAVSFLNGMLQYDLKKRLTAEKLNNHKFLTMPYSKLNKINVKEVSDKIIGSQIKINSKQNQSIWIFFETDDNNKLDDIPSNMYENLKDIQPQESNIQEHYKDKNKEEKKLENDYKKNKKIDEKNIKNEFLEAIESMNDDFIYIEPKLIPIIPGSDPEVISKVSEISEDNF